MAGTVVNYSVSNYGISDAKLLTAAPGMEEDVVLDQLNDQSFNKRAEILDQLRATARISKGRLPFANKTAIFNGLSLALSDSNWDVRHKCVQLICDLIPSLDDDLEACMNIVNPRLVQNIGHSKITIRRAVIQTLHVYMKNTRNVTQVFRAIIKYGLEGEEVKMRKETIIALPMLFTPEFSKANFYEIVQCLGKKLLDNSAEDNLQGIALLSLEKIRNLVGDDIFNSYMQKLSPSLRKYYLQLTDKPLGEKNGVLETNNNLKKDDVSSNQVSSRSNRPTPQRTNSESLEFGIIPSHIMAQLHDQEDFRTRSLAVEELRTIVEDLQDSSLLMPHIIPFISFINNLLDDSNFKITTVALEILYLLVGKLNESALYFLKPLISALTKRMGDNKIVVRQAIMKVATKLMHTLGAKRTLQVLCENLNHRNSRVRQETINIVIASLLTFPSYDFDQSELCQTVAYCLVDSKRQVRQAALECFAVLAQAMGAGRLQPLVQAVDKVELAYEGDGVMAAVQARLARRQLPKLNASGLVDYAIPVPSSATQRNIPMVPQGADMEWIMAASGAGGNSARSTRFDYMELESVTSSARSTPLDSSFGASASRRFYSAGRGKNRLPWDEDEEDDSYSGSASQNRRSKQNENIPPSHPRTTWGENNTNDNTRRASREPSPDSASNSYKQIHLDKIKRQQAEEKSRSLSSTYPGRTALSDEKTSPRSAPTAEGRSAPSSEGRSLRKSSYSVDYDFSPDTSINLGYSYVPTPDTSIRDSAAFNKSSNSPSKRSYNRTYSNDPPLNNSINGSYGDGVPGRQLKHRISLSSSWPDAKNFEEAGLPNRTILDPISAPETPTSTDQTEYVDRADERRYTKETNDSPIHLKPTIARGSASRRNKVPPIPKASDSLPSPRGDSDSAGLDNSVDNVPEEMLSSLRQIRHSASKKKAEKLFDNVEKKERHRKGSRSPSPRDSLNESGIFSAFSTLNSTAGEDIEEKKKGKKTESPFESKPRLARHSSNNKLTDIAVDDKKSRNNKAETRNPPRPEKVLKVDSNALDYNPTSGVTFRQNKTSDVKVVGHGYSEGSAPTDPRPSPTAAKARDRRRLTKGSLLSPLGMASAHLYGQVDMDDDKIPGEQDSIGVVGRGMFDSPNQMDQKIDHRTERRTSDRYMSMESDEEPSEVAMSNTLKQRMASKLKQREEEVEQRRLEKEQEAELRRQEREREKERQQKIREDKRKRREEEKQQEKERAQERLRSLQHEDPVVEDLSVMGNRTSHTPTKKPPVATPPRKKSSSPSELSKPPLSASMRNPADEVLEPLPNPDNALKDAIRWLAQDDWQMKCDGLSNIRRLVIFHPESLRDLHSVTLSVMAEVKNLRSQVSRLAITTMGDFYSSLKKNMEADLDMTIKILLHKNGDSNSFIREDVEKALTAMVENVTPQRALVALINGGQSHRNIVVRRTTSYFLVALVERMGPGRILSGVKDITDRVLPAAAHFLIDGSPETRYNARKIVHTLMQHSDFDKVIPKHLSQNLLRNVKDCVDNLKQKGLGEMPTDRPSARARRSGQGTRGSVVGSSSAASSDQFSTPSSKKRVTRVDEATAETIKEMSSKMVATDWRDRLEAVSNFKEMCDNYPAVVGQSIMKIFDKFNACLKDSNSKVNLHALCTMLEVTPLLRDYLGPTVNITVPAIATNLMSKNKEIYSTAMEILDAFLDHLDGAVLLQPFANVAQSGNLRVKPDMVDKLAYLVTRVYPRKQKQVHLHVLPLLWHLLGNVTGSGAVHGSSGNMRNATSKLVHSLYSHMGSQLLDIASQNSTVPPRSLEQLQDMIDNPVT